MPARIRTPEDLIALFSAKAAAAPTEANQLLVRHLQCKESIRIARIVSEAIDRYSGNGNPSFPAPTELLPPLG
jgi:hypothetical protein